MMNYRVIASLGAVLLLNGCSSELNSNVSGSVSKGPVNRATIIAYNISGQELGRGQSDKQGRFSFDLDKNKNNQVIIFKSTSGTYTDEATGIQNVKAPDMTLARRLNLRKVDISISPLTDLAYQLAHSKGEISNISNSNKNVAKQFGLGEIDITKTTPTDLTTEIAGQDAQGYYGTALALISQTQKDDVTLDSPEKVIRMLKTDMNTNKGRIKDSATKLRNAARNAKSNPSIRSDDSIIDSIVSGIGGNKVLVSSVSLNATEKIIVGAVKQLSALVIPANANDKSLVWSSSNKSIATVTKEGLVTAIRTGSTTITVTTSNKKTARSVVTVIKNGVVNSVPQIKNNHPDITIFNIESVHNTSTDFSLLFSDDVTAVSKMEYKIVNYDSIPSSFGLSIGMDSVASADYKNAAGRPQGNDIHVHPAANFTGTTSVILKARDEAGNESSDMRFTLTIKAPPVADKKPGIKNYKDTLVVQDHNLSGITFSNTGGGAILSCKSEIPLGVGLKLEVTADRTSCRITGKPSGYFDTTYKITARNSKGVSTATITIVSQKSTDDADKDGLTNGQELDNKLDPLNGADADANNDRDLLTNKEEIRLGMDLHVTNDGVGGRSNEEKFRYHVANRLSYGASDSLLTELKAQGINNWINKQLDNPNTKLSADSSQTKRETVRQNFTSDHTGAAIIAAARAVHSNYPLQTVMGDFWDNHFSTLFSAAGIGPQELFEQDDLYLNALGNFGKLLEKSAKSRTMITYLNSNMNVKDKANENYAREVMELSSLGIHPNGFQAYDANTIKALSKIFTGWTYKKTDVLSRYKWYSPDFRDPKKQANKVEIQTFNFVASRHNDGSKDFDGDGKIDGDKQFILKSLAGSPITYTIRSRSGASGVQEGEEVLRILASHPSTARYICLKLARKFVNDNPSEVTISACSSTFLQYKDAATQIAQVLKVLFSSDEFKNSATFSGKMKDTQEYVLSLYRLLELDAIDGSSGTGTSRTKTAGNHLSNTKHQFFNHGPPTGYPEISAKWNNTETHYNRNRVSNDIISRSSSQSLKTYFQTKGLNTAAGIIRFIVPIMTAGNYDQSHLKVAYDILYKDGSQFKLQEDRLRVLVSFFAQLPAYHLQ